MSPDRDLPLESVKNHAITEGSNGLSDKMEPANEGSTENDKTEQSEQDVPNRLQHQRRPPQILTYNFQGNPQYQCVETEVSSSFVKSIHAPAAAAIHPGKPLYFWVWPCCLQPVYY